ncbi:RNA--NAD 2'-phosphotransferase [Aliifodinibius salipaludis]|uniref:Probable RNA 2'-phosphotransferase n=1 Tax=Fodinibius salipaludis TaxID=2032627 RepID=A0A2A2GCY2_9BACT|nr:RNA 2'-phosphotransferase [Aliifodinibius salipaludis]PAU94753.1 RNA--NAD 2'-phosphotransferase [Aliifodinibius salipaludis]
MDLTAHSKFLSYVLRHHPEAIGLEVDENGWAEVSALIEKAKKHGRHLDRNIIKQIIEKSSKNRFILSGDGQYIRAGYGHSIDVDLQLKSKAPPEKLYHGTARNNVESILADGIKARNRNFVHLSTTVDEARNVGGRHGSPVILNIKASKMHKDGIKFYQSESEQSIWLTSYVPPEYIEQR